MKLENIGKNNLQRRTAYYKLKITNLRADINKELNRKIALAISLKIEQEVSPNNLCKEVRKTLL